MNYSNKNYDELLGELHNLRERLFDTVNQNLKLLSIIDLGSSLGHSSDPTRSLRLACYTIQDSLPEHQFSLLLAFGNDWKLFKQVEGQWALNLIEKVALNREMLTDEQQKYFYTSNDKTISFLKPVIAANFAELDNPSDFVIFPLIAREEDAILGFMILHQKDRDLSLDEIRLLEICQRQLGNMLLTSYFYQLSNIDSLSGLFNRRFTLAKLHYELKRATRNKDPLSIVLIDLDNFKKVNDDQGHLAGDNVISQTGILINESVREVDIACRYGGDEFLLVLPETDVEKAMVVVERFRKKLSSDKFLFQGSTCAVTASIGVSQFQPGIDASPDEFIDRTDKALYQAKRTGKNLVVVANES